MKAFNDSAEAFLDFTRIEDVKKHGEPKPASLGNVDSCFYCLSQNHVVLGQPIIYFGLLE